MLATKNANIQPYPSANNDSRIPNSAAGQSTENADGSPRQTPGPTDNTIAAQTALTATANQPICFFKTRPTNGVTNPAANGNKIIHSNRIEQTSLPKVAATIPNAAFPNQSASVTSPLQPPGAVLNRDGSRKK
jgi:hypothetical protein